MIARAGVFALLLSAVLAAQTPPPNRDAAWREDIAYFARELAAGQKDFDTLYPRALFDAAIQSIVTDLPTSTDAAVTLNLMHIVASAHVGHTNMRIPMDGPLAFRRLPISVQWFADGLVVTAATEPYREAIGLRVQYIGALSPERIESAVAAYVSYETDSWLRLQSQTYMVAVDVLRAIGQADAEGRVSITLTKADGSPLVLKLSPMAWRDPTPMLSAIDVLSLPVGPARKDPNRNYQYEIIPDSKTLYIRYNRCADDPAQPFADFVKEIFARVDADPKSVDRVVVDLRTNGGGNSAILAPLVAGLKSRKALSAKGRLFVLTGPGTFSSGLMAAIDLKALDAVLVGEAPGEKLNSYGEVRSFTLSNSKLIVQYSTKFFRLSKDVKIETLEPELKVKRTVADFLAGRDPVLEVALKKEPKP